MSKVSDRRMEKSVCGRVCKNVIQFIYPRYTEKLQRVGYEVYVHQRSTELEFGVWVLWRGKTEEHGEEPSEQGREPTTD